MASDGSSSPVAPTLGKEVATLQSEGWVTADGVLALEHDAAHVQWGGTWRMPTGQELDGLNSNCNWTWTTTNGVNGYVIRGRGEYASASIFLPCVGYGYDSLFDDAGSYGCYWSSVPDSYDNAAWGLYFGSYSHNTARDIRNLAQPVRPVQGFTE